MEFVYALISLLVVALLYLLIKTIRERNRKSERIRELEREAANLRNRRMTASGGLSAADKLKVLDLIAIVDTLQDDNELMKLRIADLKNRLIAILQNNKRR